MKGENKEEQKVADVIDSNLLLLSGGVFKNYEKGEYIFREGQQPHFYHQIIQGKVRMVNEMDDGKEFIQGFFSAGESFGDASLFIPDTYPATAIAAEPSVIIRLSIATFIELLRDNFDVHWNITRLLSQRTRNKSIALREIISRNPYERVLFLLNKYKEDQIKDAACGTRRVKIEYTRKHIADMCGLRVETVIRVMRSLHDKKVLVIEKGKVFY